MALTTTPAATTGHTPLLQYVDFAPQCYTNFQSTGPVPPWSVNGVRRCVSGARCVAPPLRHSSMTRVGGANAAPAGSLLPGPGPAPHLYLGAAGVGPGEAR